MRVMNALGTAIVFSAVGLGIGCSDGDGGSPTESRAVPTDAAFLSSDDGNDGSGSNFKIFGDARMTRDPENPANIVLRVDKDGPTDLTASGVSRKLRNVQLWQLDHQLNAKYAFVAPHSCGGGSPRMILLIDVNGNGRFRTSEGDFAANGQVNPPVFSACPTSAVTPNSGGPAPSTLLWRFEDFTDEGTRWEITPGGATATIPGFPPYPGATWDVLEQVISTAFPGHRVLEALFLEDFNNTPGGTSYYDLITIHDLTLGTRGQTQPEKKGNDDRDSDNDDD